MRAFTILGIIGLLFFSCNKNDEADRNSVIGLWKLTAYFISDGSPGKWQSTIFSHPSYVEFTADQKMITTHDSIVTTTTYTITSDSTITIQTQGLVDVPCRYELKSNELLIFPLNCIEGCASKYTAVNHK